MCRLAYPDTVCSISGPRQNSTTQHLGTCLAPLVRQSGNYGSRTPISIQYLQLSVARQVRRLCRQRCPPTPNEVSPAPRIRQTSEVSPARPSSCTLVSLSHSRMHAFWEPPFAGHRLGSEIEKFLSVHVRRSIQLPFLPIEV